MQNEQEYAGVEYVAERLNVTVATVRKMCRVSKIVGMTKVGKSWLVSVSIFDEWLSSRCKGKKVAAPAEFQSNVVSLDEDRPVPTPRTVTDGEIRLILGKHATNNVDTNRRLYALLHDQKMRQNMAVTIALRNAGRRN